MLILYGDHTFVVFFLSQTWQGNIKSRALAKGGFGPDPAAHGFDTLFDEIKTETGATDGASVGIVDAIEFLEDMADIVGGNTDAGVGDIN